MVVGLMEQADQLGARVVLVFEPVGQHGPGRWRAARILDHRLQKGVKGHDSQYMRPGGMARFAPKTLRRGSPWTHFNSFTFALAGSKRRT